MYIRERAADLLSAVECGYVFLSLDTHTTRKNARAKATIGRRYTSSTSGPRVRGVSLSSDEMREIAEQCGRHRREGERRFGDGYGFSD